MRHSVMNTQQGPVPGTLHVGPREGEATELPVAQGHVGHGEPKLPASWVTQSVPCPFPRPQIHLLHGGALGHACLSLTHPSVATA